MQIYLHITSGENPQNILLVTVLLKHNSNMPCHEVITLQFGSYANHVGAHFWNLQVSGAYSC